MVIGHDFAEYDLILSTSRLVYEFTSMPTFHKRLCILSLRTPHALANAPAIAEARIDAAARNDVLGLVVEPRADERISLPLIEIGPRALVF